MMDLLQNWLFLLPELSFLSFLVVAVVVNAYRETKTPKTFFTLSKVFLLFAILSTVIFYNKSAFPALWMNTPYTTLFKIVIYLIALTWLYLSSKWYLNKSRSSFLFYFIVMADLLLFELLLSAQSLIMPAMIVPLLCLSNWRLLKLRIDDDNVEKIAQLYAFFSALFVLLLWGGVAIILDQCGSLAYAEVNAYIKAQAEISIWIYAGVGMLLASLLFMLGAAPFHSWFVGIISVAILPVSGFLTLIPPFVFLACLITTMVDVFMPLVSFVKPLLIIFGGVSLFVGALSANGEKNIRSLFAFSSIYNLGFMLFSIVSFNDNAILSAFAYTIVYVLAMAGIYTAFLGLKSRGEYVVNLRDVSGLSEVRPYISSAMLIFMVSLIGIPPMLGFLGRLSIINNLVTEERWTHVVILMTALLFMANAYLQVIRTIYFEPLKNSFDRTDKSIYICLFINLVLVAISILNPSYLLEDAEIILKSVF